MKVVIIGGVAGGATAAARIRRLDEQAEIVVFDVQDLSHMLTVVCRTTSAAPLKMKKI